MQPPIPKGAKTQKVADFLRGNFACNVVMRQKDLLPREYPLIPSTKVLDTIKEWMGVYIDTYVGVLLNKDTLEVKFHSSEGTATIVTITFITPI